MIERIDKYSEWDIETEQMMKVVEDYQTETLLTLDTILSSFKQKEEGKLHTAIKLELNKRK